MSQEGRTLYIVTCGSSSAPVVHELVPLALGVSDTLAVGILCEYRGLDAPIIAVPGVTTGTGLDTHPAFQRSIRQLRECGVKVIYEPDRYPPRNEVPCPVVIEELQRMISERG